MRAILITILMAASAAAFADACNEFRSKRLTEIAVGEAFNRAVYADSKDAASIGIAYDEAVDALRQAERAVVSAIHDRGGNWSNIVELLMTSSGRIANAGEIILIGIPNGDKKSAVLETVRAAAREAESAYYKAILLACDQKP